MTRIRDDQGLILLLGLGTTAGIAAMALVLVPALARTGVRLRPYFAWRHPAVRRVLRLSGWTVGYVVVNQLALLFVLVLAKTGDAGGVSAYQYAFIFFQLPHGLFAVSIMTAITPELAHHAAAQDRDAFRREFATGLRYLLLVVIPAAVGLAVLAQPAVSVLVRGGFGPNDAAVTADTLQALALGLVPFSVYLFTLRGFYAQQDTRTPFFVNAAENGVNVVLALALFPAFGVQGLGLAYAGAYLVAALAALSLLAGRIGPITELVLPTAVRALAGAAVLAIVAAPLAAAIGRSSPARAALAVAVAGAAGAGAYLLTLVFVRASEAGAVLRAVRRPRERPAGGQNV